MSNIYGSMKQLSTIEELSVKDTCIHRLHPMAKLIVTVVFVITVVSSDRYNFARLLPYFAYPFIIGALSEVPQNLLAKRAVYALPFCVFAGLSNIIFERNTALIINDMPITFGILSFITIILKTYLTVTAVLLLTATTPVNGIFAQLLKLKIPTVIVIQLSIMYRYITILTDEASTLFNAYILRSNGMKAIKMKNMGSFLGQLLIRSMDRAERVHKSMQCFGFNGIIPFKKTKAKKQDYIYCTALCVIIIAGGLL